jgi:hypothetical protein
MRSWVGAVADPSRRAGAREIAARYRDVITSIPAHLRAPLYAGLGMDEEAIGVLEAAADAREIATLGLKSVPLYDRLRRHPRFVALVARLGLPPDC